MIPLGQVVGFQLNMIQVDEIWTTSKKTHTIQYGTVRYVGKEVHKPFELHSQGMSQIVLII